MIDILVPVLGRPQNAQVLVDNVARNTSVSYRLMFLCSPSDRRELVACRRTGAETIQVDWEPGCGDFAKKINCGFARTESEFVFLGADDLNFHEGWAEAALRAASQGAGVIGTQDAGNAVVVRGQHATHSLVRRSYVAEQGATFTSDLGIVYCELYDHQCVDNELVAVAKARKQWVFARDSLVEHLHPLWKKSPMDATYQKALRKGKEDIYLFRDRQRAFSRV